MFRNIRLLVVRLMVITSLFIISSEVNAQSEEFYYYYNTAVESFNNSEYEKVPLELRKCIKEIENSEFDDLYLNGEGQEWVFRVYRLITLSLGEAENYKQAEEFENELVEYFSGQYSREEVHEILEDTEI